jgi:hypothetical protein
MPSAGEIRRQIDSEIERRRRLAVPAFAGGFLYLLGAVIIASTLNGAPTVGLFQGLSPALSGVSNPAVSPRAPELRFISSHSFDLIAGSVIAAIAIIALTLILLLLLDAAIFRRPKIWAYARPLVLFGGIAFALVSVAHQIVSAIETHKFVSGSDHSSHAVEQALTGATPNVIIAYLDLLAGLSLAAGMVIVMLNTQRVGLLPRWLSMLGMVTALLLFFPFGGAQLQIVPAFWMVMIGILFIGKWPTEPPAWVTGEARPWPTAAERRAKVQEARGEVSGKGAGPETTPSPAPAGPPPSSRQRRRKPGASGNGAG